MNWNKIVKISGVILLAFIWIYPVANYASLPKMIPIHFDLHGKADGFGNRILIFLMPVVATFLYWLLQYLSKNPDSELLNVPNAMRKNRNLTKNFVKMMLMYILILFAVITFESIEIAKGNYHNLTKVSTVIIVLMFATIIGYFIYARKKITKIH